MVPLNCIVFNLGGVTHGFPSFEGVALEFSRQVIEMFHRCNPDRYIHIVTEGKNHYTA